jgi:hypothetical protein
MIPSVKLLKRSRTDGNYKETNIDTNMNTNTKTNTSGDNKNDNLIPPAIIKEHRHDGFNNNKNTGTTDSLSKYKSTTSGNSTVKYNDRSNENTYRFTFKVTEKQE